MKDARWTDLLSRLRVGACNAEDMDLLRSLSFEHSHTDYSSQLWRSTCLITSRNEVRRQWNEVALIQHCLLTGNVRYICVARDVISTDATPTTAQRALLASLPAAKTGRLEEFVSLAVGMQVMLLCNLSTDADLANGTRGTVDAIFLHPDEKAETIDGVCKLQYPPPMVYFRPLVPTDYSVEGVPAGVLPIVPTCTSFVLKPVSSSRNPIHALSQGKPNPLASGNLKVTRLQHSLTPAYAFTHYKCQGQTMDSVIVDISTPPQGRLSKFAPYVALSRSRGRETIRILRDFDTEPFLHHPSTDLASFDMRLQQADDRTHKNFDSGKYNYI